MILINKINNYSVRLKLIGIFALIIAISLIGGVLMFSFTNTSSGGAYLAGILGHEEVLIVEMNAKSAIMNIRSSSGSYTNGSLDFSSDLSTLKNVRLEFEQILLGLRFGDTQFNLRGFSDSAYINIWENINRTYSTLFQPLVKAVESSNGIITDEQVFQLDTEKTTMIGVLLAFKTRIENDAEAGIQLALPTSVLIPLVTLIIGIVAILILNSSISRPLLHLSRDSMEIASGNLTVQIQENELNRNDEIGVLSQSFDKMLTNFRETIKRISATADQINESAQLVASSSEEVNASSEEISSIAQQMSQGSMEQSNRTSNSSKQADGLKEVFYEKIINIEGASKAIEGLTNQINMLSLNASIEAARAGEYGRGFAVVADNIRNLADESTKLLENINFIIRELKTTLEGNINSIQISIQEIVVISEDNVAGAEEASAATEEQAATMEELSAASQELATIANELTSVVKEFKI
ncbi:MAG: methyl-accepting chemotaxis protein [Candidatus Heimdallarchaeota archaeon]